MTPILSYALALLGGILGGFSLIYGLSRNHNTLTAIGAAILITTVIIGLTPLLPALALITPNEYPDNIIRTVQTTIYAISSVCLIALIALMVVQLRLSDS